MAKQIISASEMERYGYCPLSWYLDLRGIDAEGDEVNTGVEKHKIIGDSLKNLLVEEGKSRETSTTLMTIIGLIMTVVTIALIILWVSTDVLRQNMGVILLIIGIGWMLIAAFFLYRLLLSTEKIDQLRDDYNLGEEAIETPDGLTEETPVLKSRKYNLAGRPDYMIKKDDLRIPVEVKTGRRPKAPFFSHVLQLSRV